MGFMEGDGEFNRGDWNQDEVQQALLEHIAGERVKLDRARFAVGMIATIPFFELTPAKWAIIVNHAPDLASTIEFASEGLLAAAKMVDVPEVMDAVGNQAFDEVFGKES